MSASVPIHIINASNIVGEGILWNGHAGQLWWTDIQSSLLYSFDWESERLEVYGTPERLGSFGFVVGGERLIAAFARHRTVRRGPPAGRLARPTTGGRGRYTLQRRSGRSPWSVLGRHHGRRATTHGRWLPLFDWPGREPACSGARSTHFQRPVRESGRQKTVFRRFADAHDLRLRPDRARRCAEQSASVRANAGGCVPRWRRGRCRRLRVECTLGSR